MADLGLLERLDGMAGLRNALHQMAAQREDWAGIPMPLDGSPLVIEPHYPKAAELMKIGRQETDEEEGDGARVRNRFWSWHRHATVVVWEEGGKILWGPQGRSNHIGQLLSTLGASDAWGIEQEARAVQTLGTMIRHRQFKQYLLTGMFMESSPRSGVHYLFRKLRPTLAISGRTGDLRTLCALCLHPIGYYSNSWAGAMCPTDDVIAVLALMRGDEHMLWKRANQIPVWMPEAGV